ncbi:catalase [Pulveribacter suum]|uniref:Catalase n=1 Tax=Pulveribacter suum TaxID=2116657 RepID=A0A2P1NL96_9BURK|nr:catalase [Pulveribacter suum]AVP57822.1 catalase HPII [Pulveribacter suum]
MTKKKSVADATSAEAAARNTDSGPATVPEGMDTPAAAKAGQTQQLAAAMPDNPAKPSEYGEAGGLAPSVGATAEAASRLPLASALSEENSSAKTGTVAPAGRNNTIDTLDRVRVDSTGQVLTTNQGVPISDNQNTLSAGVRGPALLEDFILREKLTHFDHERIPERVVHARGSGAHGYFECTEALSDITRAAPFQQVGKKTPVFVRFSTVQGERGSKDTARDVRGFAVKFYTDEGNWDLVGNNMPVFFIQDAMKFPDLVHAVKPEPHHQMPQAASAHDTFWDFVSLMPESTHMLMWQMSDRAIPRSFATMQGFGVHTFRFVNAEGKATLVKFHWLPLAGTHSLVWDEAVKISGADPDFNRRDLWERIDSGAYPQWDLAVQLFTEEQAESFSFDVLDSTKLIPEELVPLRVIGRMTLDRNPDNFFAETEQVAFCIANVIRGIDFTNDPLLAGRIHSYLDTQLLRLGGPNFHEIPINAPVVQVHNNQRDGFHRQAIPRGRVAYEPNSLAGGCPFQAGMQGYMTVPAREENREGTAKIRAKPEKFAEHYVQARLFLDSQTPAEQAHIAAAFRFELSKVTVPAVRERMVASLRNVSEEFAAQVGKGLGMDPLPAPLTPVVPNPPKPEVMRSEFLSLMARPGDGSIAGRKVAIVVGSGTDAALARELQKALLARGAVGRFVGTHIGAVAAQGGTLDADASTENSPAYLFDALAIPGADEQMGIDGHLDEFVRDTYRHCKPILATGGAGDLVRRVLPAGLDTAQDQALVLQEAAGQEALERFVTLVGAPRDFARETDPPRV